MESNLKHCSIYQDISGFFCDEVLALLRFQYPFATYSNGYAEIKKMKAKFLASILPSCQGRIRILIIF